MTFWDKLLNWLGLEARETEIEGADHIKKPPFSNHRKVIGLPTARGAWRLVVAHPANFDEARDLAEHLRSYRPLLVNLEGMRGEQAQRLIDFLSGAAFALQGQVRKINGGIFLFAPSNVDISGDYLSQLESRPGWVKLKG